jgi:hypothetical protein
MSLQIDYPSYQPAYKSNPTHHQPRARKPRQHKNTWVSRPLNPEAMSFIPGKIMHTRKRLNPLAKPFVPGELWMVDEPGIHSQVFGEELAVFCDRRV